LGLRGKRIKTCLGGKGDEEKNTVLPAQNRARRLGPEKAKKEGQDNDQQIGGREKISRQEKARTL